MIEAYEIGAKIVLDDKILGSLDGVIGGFGKVEDAISRTNAMLKDTASLMSGVAGAARSMASSWQAAATAAERMSRAATGMGAPGVYGGGGRDGGGGYLGLPAPDSDGQRYLPGPGGGGGGGFGGVPGEDAPFNDPGRPNLNLGGAGGGGGGFDPINAMSYMFVAQAGANAVGSTVSGFVMPGFDIQTQLNQIGNMTPIAQSRAFAQSQALATARELQQKYPGMTIGDALGMITNAYTIDRNMGDASTLAQRYAEDNYAIGNISNPDIRDQLYAALRGGEDAGYFNGKDGKIDPTRELNFLETAARLAISTNNNVTPAGDLTMIGAAGPGATQMSPVAMMRALVASQALGPSVEGTGLNAMYQEFIGGKMSQATARSLHEAGDLPDYMFGKDGKILNQYKYGIGQVMLPPGTLKDEDQAISDPVEWAKTHLFQQYFDSNGLLKPGQANAEGFIAATQRDFSRLPGGKVAAQAVMNAIIQDRVMGNTNNMPTLGQIVNNDMATANVQAKGVGAAWNGFLAAMDSPLIPGATAGLSMLTASLNKLGNIATAQPGATKAIDLGIIDSLGYGVGKIVGGVATKVGWKAGAAATSDAALGPLGILVAAIEAALAAGRADNDSNAQMHPNNKFFDAPLFGTASDPVHVVVTNGVPLVSPSPTMPTGPTRPNQAVISRRPGAVNPLISRQ